MFKRIFNKEDNNLLAFRRNVILECNGDPLDAEVDYFYSKLKEKYKNNPKIEDIYRYTNKKWNETNFDHVDTYWINNEISCISGSVIYNNWIKGAVYHYNLKKYSVQTRTLFFQDNGMLDRLIEYANDKNLDGVFISIYPHNYKLSALVTRMKNDLSIPTTGNLNKIRSMKYYGSNVINNVSQEIFYYPIKCEFNSDIILQ
jgi:hypothetical protein